VNRAYLEKVASLAGGKSYFLNEPAGLEQILLKDVMEHTGSTAIEKSLKPVVAKKVEILDGVGIELGPEIVDQHFAEDITAGFGGKILKKRNPSALLRCFRGIELCNTTTTEGFRV